MAGMPWHVGGLTVNKVCGSGLKAVMLAAQAIQAGDADVVVAGGMENMSMAPFYLEKARFGYRMGTGKIDDHMVHDGLWDIVNDFHMGISNELCSEKYKHQQGGPGPARGRILPPLARRDQGRAVQGRDRPREIKPAGASTALFDTDECPRETSYEELSKMKAAFKEGGLTTAGNASVISDGAAAVVVMSREKAAELGCTVRATLGAQAAHGIDMKYVLVAPIWAMPKCLKKEGISIKDVDLFEVNEAFSGSTVAVMKELSLDPEKVNVNGGCVAMGHPIGASGCRVLVSIIHELERRKKHTGLCTLCLGGGEAVAMVVRV